MPILFDMDVNVKHYAGPARHYIMCSLCVAAAALLVLSNKILLSHLPSTGAPVLTLLHNLIGIIAPRACCRGAGRRRQSRAPCAQDVSTGHKLSFDTGVDPEIRPNWRWLAACGAAAMVNVLASNFVLYHSTVAFQQLARTATVPASAAVDYVSCPGLFFAREQVAA